MYSAIILNILSGFTKAFFEIIRSPKLIAEGFLERVLETFVIHYNQK